MKTVVAAGVVLLAVMSGPATPRAGNSHYGGEIVYGSLKVIDPRDPSKPTLTLHSDRIEIVPADASQPMLTVMNDHIIIGTGNQKCEIYIGVHKLGNDNEALIEARSKAKEGDLTGHNLSRFHLGSSDQGKGSVFLRGYAADEKNPRIDATVLYDGQTPIGVWEVKKP